MDKNLVKELEQFSIGLHELEATGTVLPESINKIWEQITILLQEHYNG